MEAAKDAEPMASRGRGTAAARGGAEVSEAASSMLPTPPLTRGRHARATSVVNKDTAVMRGDSHGVLNSGMLNQRDETVESSATIEEEKMNATGVVHVAGVPRDEERRGAALPTESSA